MPDSVVNSMMRVDRFINAVDTSDITPSEPCCNEHAQCVAYRVLLFPGWCPVVVTGGVTTCILDYLILIVSCCEDSSCYATRSFCNCMCNRYRKFDDGSECCPPHGTH
jgi:hypothetical protein